MKAKLIFTGMVISAFLACTSASNGGKDAGNDTKSPETSTKKTGRDSQNKPKDNPYKNAKVEVKVFNNDSIKQDNNPHGYGYDIYVYDAVTFHQSNVPAINGNRGFHTREQARKAGEYVANKVRNNIMPPSVTVQELDSLGVLK